MFVLEYWSVFVIFGFPEFQIKKELNKRNDLDLRMSKKNLRIFVLSELQENQKHRVIEHLKCSLEGIWSNLEP